MRCSATPAEGVRRAKRYKAVVQYVWRIRGDFTPSEGVGETCCSATPSEGVRGAKRYKAAVQYVWRIRGDFTPSAEGVGKTGCSATPAEGVGRVGRRHGEGLWEEVDGKRTARGVHGIAGVLPLQLRGHVLQQRGGHIRVAGTDILGLIRIGGQVIQDTMRGRRLLRRPVVNQLPVVLAVGGES